MITSQNINYLCEEYFHMKRIRSHAVDVYVNPTLDEIKSVASKKRNRIRFTANVLEKKLFIWDAMLAIHYDVLPILGSDYIDTKPNILGGIVELHGNTAVMIGWDNFYHLMDVLNSSNRSNVEQFLLKLFSYDWTWLEKYFQASKYLAERKQEFENALHVDNRKKRNPSVMNGNL